MKLEINVIEKTETKVVLENESGDTFEFNPRSKNGEELFDFLFY